MLTETLRNLHALKGDFDRILSLRRPALDNQATHTRSAGTSAAAKPKQASPFLPLPSLPLLTRIPLGAANTHRSLLVCTYFLPYNLRAGRTKLVIIIQQRSDIRLKIVHMC